MRKNILLNLEVAGGFRGNVKSALDETYELAKELNMGCVLNYVNQYTFTIYPTMSKEDIEVLKNRKLVIGV